MVLLDKVASKPVILNLYFFSILLMSILLLIFMFLKATYLIKIMLIFNYKQIFKLYIII